MTSSSNLSFKQLRVVVVGGGLGGLSAAVALRRAVDIYERRDFNVEVGASISCAANGTQWLREWDVDIADMKPVILMKLVMRDWDTGRILNQYNLDNYEQEWGNVYNMFHRQDMHATLLKTATSPEGKGTPATVVIDHICQSVDPEKGTVTFTNGRTISADLIIGADGIRSVVRGQIGIVPQMKSGPQTCYRCNVLTSDVKKFGLVDYSCEPAIHYWGGMEGKSGRSKFYKIVMSPCSSYEIISFYAYRNDQASRRGFVFEETPIEDILIGRYNELDPDCVALLKHSVDRMPWRLYKHEPYPNWYKHRACILGDAAHPMMPHQSQGACMAIEDAAALGIIFSDKYDFTNNIEAGLAMYQIIRKPRGTRVQEASWRATLNINERIGFTSLTAPEAELAAAADKLTINEMNSYKMHDHIAAEVAKLSTSAQV
ncbi:salicylate hydroxylase [Armillaria luteobubalina]|uniref:Salicylate hydroxylase n=1 Tax=Armillaria luteobubalina TaxID=153913 RepID=A0AA39Q8S5_9AGAR|nr:salicylate hydroxylase [Armillaria luteobubalina]